MALPVTITGLSTAVAPVGPFCDVSTASYWLGGGTASQVIGNPTTPQLAQRFTNVKAANLKSIRLSVLTSSSPTDGLVLDVRSLDETGTLLATSDTVPAASISAAALTPVTFTFSAPVALAASAVYCFVVRRTGSLDAGKIYFIGTDNGVAGYSGGAARTYNGSTWSTSTSDYQFIIEGDAPAYYFFGRDATTATTLRAYKSTAPDTSWAVVASQTGGHGTSIDALSAFQVGNIIHIASSAGGAGTCAYNYQTFNMSTDTFPLGTSGEGITSTGVGGATNGQTGAVQHGVSIVVRSTGEVVVFCHMTQSKTSGTFYCRVGYTRRTGAAAWSAAVQVDTNIANDSTGPEAVLGISDSVHLIFRFGAASISQRTLTAANALQTSAGAGSNAPNQAISYNRSGVTKVILTQQNNNILYFNSANVPTPTNVILNSAFINTSPFAIFNDGTDAWIIGRLSTDSDLHVLKSTDDGVTWGSGATAMVGTIASGALISKDGNTYQSGNNIVLPYIVDDSGTLKYNEYVVRTLAPPAAELDLTVGAVTVAGPAQTLRAARQLILGVAAINVIGRDTQGTKGQLLTLQKGSVTLAGSTAALRADRRLFPATYSMAVAGKTATLRVGRKLQATAGAITLTGVDVNLRYGRGFMLTTQPGAVTLAGKDVDLVYTPSLITAYVLNLGTGAIGVTPTTAIVRYGHVLTAQKGAVAVSGVPANVRRAYTLSQTVGAVTLSGKTANLKYGRAFNFTAGVGAITVSMKSATLRRNRMLSLATGSIAVTGIPADLKTRINYKLTAQPGAIVVTGNPAVLTTRSDKVLRVLPGAITLTGQDATLKPSRALPLAPGVVRLTGYPVVLDHHIHQDYRMELAPAAVVVASQYAELQYGNRQPGRMTFGLRAEIPGRW